MLAITLLIMAIRDILLRQQPRALILLLLLAPIIGPLIYFQTRKKKQ